MKKRYIILITIAILISIISILFLENSFKKKKYDIILSNEMSLLYKNDVSNNYKTKVVEWKSYADYYDESKAIEMDEYSANALLKSGLGYKFIPYYNIKCVLIKNDNYDNNINSLTELKKSKLNVYFNYINDLNTTLNNMSISYAINNEYDIDNSINYLKKLKLNKKGDDLNKYDYIIGNTILYENIKSDGNYSIVNLSDSMLECNLGLLVIDKHIKLDKYEEILLNHNLKNNEFENSFKCDNYEIFGDFSVNRVAKYRRNILNTYKFSGATSDERSIVLILFIIIMIPWAIAIGFRINDKKIRKAIIICLSMVLSWLVLRYLKSHFYNDTMMRYIWYLNYLPLLFSPCLFLNANIRMTFDDNKKIKKLRLVFFIISYILLFLVLTNDLTELVFKFDKGLSNWQTYSFNIFFYVIYAMGFIELIIGIILLLKKNYKQINIYERLAPIIIFLIIFIYIACDFVGVSYAVELDYTLVVCFFALFMWEVTLRCGLVQNCGRYKMLFSDMTFDMAIYNNSDTIIYKTMGFEKYNNENNRSSKLIINSGYTILVDDLAPLTRIRNELDDKRELLLKNNKILEEKNKIMAEFYSLKSENEILDEIDLDYKNKNEEIIKLINIIAPLNDKKEIYPYLARIKFLVSYTKQKYNNYINSKINDKIEIQNLALSINLIFDDTKALGIDLGLLCNSMEIIESKLAPIILDIIYMMIENALDNKSDLFVNIDVSNEYIIVFGLFKENSIIKYEYFTQVVNNLINNNIIDCDNKIIDDMVKFIIKIRRDL